MKAFLFLLLLALAYLCVSPRSNDHRANFELARPIVTAVAISRQAVSPHSVKTEPVTDQHSSSTETQGRAQDERDDADKVSLCLDRKARGDRDANPHDDYANDPIAQARLIECQYESNSLPPENTDELLQDD